jgi:glucokinase
MAGRAPAVVALAGGDPEAVRGEHVTTAAGRGDRAAAELLAELGWWLALGLANLANVLDPSLMVIGGGLVEAGDALLGPTRRALAALVEGHDVRADLRVVPASLGTRAGAVGAGLLGRNPPKSPSRGRPSR